MLVHCYFIYSQATNLIITTFQEVQKTVDMIERSQGVATESSSMKDGRVDYVQVKDWGTGRAEDLGDLQLAAPMQRFDSIGSFYDFLARQLEALQAEGALEVARPQGTPAPPPFSKWAFAEPHYVQYLEDLRCVHAALEQALENAKLGKEKEVLLSPLASQGDGNAAVQGMPSFVIHKCQVLGANNEIGRSSAISLDLASIRGSSEALGTLSLEPTPNAAAYAQIIKQLGVQCTRAESEEEHAVQSVKVAAHAYVIMLTLLTAGTRIGASATEKLGLFARGAVHTFTDYPKLESPPLAVFREAVDELGVALDLTQQDAFLGELPGAMRRVAVLLEALAREK